METMKERTEERWIRRRLFEQCFSVRFIVSNGGIKSNIARGQQWLPFQRKVDIVDDETIKITTTTTTRRRMICEHLSSKRSENAEHANEKVAAIVRWTNDS